MRRWSRKLGVRRLLLHMNLLSIFACISLLFHWHNVLNDIWIGLSYWQMEMHDPTNSISEVTSIIRLFTWSLPNNFLASSMMSTKLCLLGIIVYIFELQMCFDNVVHFLINDKWMCFIQNIIRTFFGFISYL